MRHCSFDRQAGGVRGRVVHLSPLIIRIVTIIMSMVVMVMMMTTMMTIVIITKTIVMKHHDHWAS